MNRCYTILLVGLLHYFPVFSQTGSSCSSPYSISLDGISRTYPASSTLGTAVVCTTYTSTSPVTWFSFTTNAQAECPLLDITSPDGNRCEVALYTGCNGGQVLQSPSSICFDDGAGLWAPSETFLVEANKTYYLRVKTESAGNITIAAQNYTPANDNCQGALSLGTTALEDNNACDHGGPDVTPGQLCAFTLENTAFYQFYVASTGSSIINISSISCDNGMEGNNSGFQIGFFKGSCSALIPINCTSGSGSFVQATTEPLDAGTKVYVAIDGMSGSNCRYSLTGINVYNVLAESEFKNFSAWQTNTSNMIRWVSGYDSSTYYEVERSGDGINFSSIGTLTRPQSQSREIRYSFEDRQPLPLGFYRIKQVCSDGRISVSYTIQVLRKQNNGIRVRMKNPVSRTLDAKVETNYRGPLNYSILSQNGQVFFQGIIQSNGGTTLLYKDISRLPGGKYLLSFSNKEINTSQWFMKLTN